MITRIWHGRTTIENARRYHQFLLEDGTAEYRQTEGNLSVKVWSKHNDNNTCEFWTVTEWDDIESIKAFAGSDYQMAKYYPFDEGMLLEFEEYVEHYDTADLSNSKIKSCAKKVEELYHGGNWVQESFQGKLKDLDEEHAFSEPIAGIHSVAEILWHCIYWRRVTLHRLRGGKNKFRDETYEKYNFLSLEELKAKGWNALRRELDETQTELIEFLKNKKDHILNNEYEPGYSYDFLLEGTIQHDYYHLGQIGLVIKMLKTRNKTSSSTKI